ncbi:hypothetical protein BJ138DRAFT_1112153 [Hygrophoropsis aurantiaca]|uniref:Uncharacterized protein n=1 Tax=Hygrophoropsis aurantiaca TaxID=72124 RepID=A0ACB8AI97_9AGAM|nr:hypothetical protein BJ138DRAFT_1112153 [Hygrophoropsis aurantiaca]
MSTSKQQAGQHIPRESVKSEPVTNALPITVKQDPDSEEDEGTVSNVQDLQLCTRSEKLWYPDGNAVLHAGDTIYRIHFSLLTTGSPVFREMSEKLLSGEVEVESFEGCPAFRLADTPKEIGSLLMTIYHPFHFRDSSHSHTFLTAILRISTKYKFEIIRANVRSELLRSFPSTLTAFDELTPERLPCPELLPSAFYFCSRLPVRTILCGDGKTAISSKDAVKCVIGREELMKTWNKRTHPFFAPTSCTECRTASGLFDYLLAKDDTEALGLDLFTKWNILGLCPRCLAPLQTTHRESRRHLWEALPHVYALGSWEELRSK